MIGVPKSESVPDVDVKIVDDAALVQILHGSKEITSLSKLAIIMHSSCSCHNYNIERMLQDVVRIDVVWDTYMEDSLKAQTRMNRGSGNHLRVSNSTNIQLTGRASLVVMPKR